ncbi:arrestin C-terminal domain-containing protein [Aspergillus clavatus NRRL 1]|uniref:Arrestin C-terminal-like domain-containing protein n=1 Tax=Aspergillus clavatus (strain ATCC 1007 / CBS 513.65 / DSM 816 / NCTC 3887 / NRRL 1 / QM 1276 / 107) TaxID=344612 RepID=A1C8U8_ASPCL|nr:uncharacterized protein ACLA_044550 [Aspergillus clavatus NRRL 1]EAW13735.1 conserved hypothetical protein [Aspergillus clavatus NRRL 1]
MSSTQVHIIPVLTSQLIIHFSWDPISHDSAAGHRKICWKELPIVHHIWSFLGQTRETMPAVLPPDNYEFSFTFPVSNRLPESLEGLDDSSIRYTLRAEIHAGNGETIKITKRLTVHRRYDSLLIPEPKVLMLGIVIENFWSGKVVYTVSMPSQAFPFGSEVPLNFQFIPLRKGLELESINCQLVEIEERKCPLQAIRSRDILTDNYTAAGWGDVIPSSDGADWYHIIRRLQLPRNRRKCRQSHPNSTMPIRHLIRVDIRIANRDGHVSLIRLTLPIFIHFSPLSSATGDNMSETPAFPSMSAPPDVFLPHYKDHCQDKFPGEALSVPETREKEKEPPSYFELTDLSTIPSYSATLHFRSHDFVRLLEEEDVH